MATMTSTTLAKANLPAASASRSLSRSSLNHHARRLGRQLRCLRRVLGKRARATIALLLILWGITIFLTTYHPHQLKSSSSSPTLLGSGATHTEAHSTQPHSIAVVVMLKKPVSADKYKLAIATQRCYAGLQNYPFYLFYMEHRDQPPESPWESSVIEKCVGSRLKAERTLDGRQGQFMFDRLCVLAELLAAHPEHDYVLYLDADIGVINPQRRIEEFIDAEREANLIFYEREITWEIMAGAFIARNTVQTRNFLNYWYNYTWELARQMNVPHDSIGYLSTLNRDQGALHEIFMEMFASPAEKEKCDTIHFDRKAIQIDVPKYVACVRHYLESHVAKRGHDGSYYFYNETIGVIKVLAKYASFARDGTILGGTESWSEDIDFMLHGWKEEYADIPTVDQAGNQLRFPHWTRLITGEEPFDSHECSSSRWGKKEEIIKRYWRDRYRRELILAGDELAAFFEERKQLVHAEFEEAVEKALAYEREKNTE